MQYFKLQKTDNLEIGDLFFGPSSMCLKTRSGNIGIFRRVNKAPYIGFGITEFRKLGYLEEGFRKAQT